MTSPSVHPSATALRGPAAVDPRVRRSRAALEGALWELIKERDLNQISISDITKRAGVNRSTFYEHYSDVHDLAACAATEMFDELVQSTVMTDVTSAPLAAPPDNPLAHFFRHVADRAPLYRALLGADGSARVIHHLLRRIMVGVHTNRRVAGTELPNYSLAPEDYPHDPEAAIIGGAIMGTVADWVQRGCPGTPEELADAVWPRLISIVVVAGLDPLPPD